MPTPHSPEKRQEALDLCQNYPTSKVSEMTGIPARTIRSWKGVTGVSTLYGPEGEKLVWEKCKLDDSQEALEEAVEALKAELPRYKPIKAPRACDESLMVQYPVGDHHMGMLAWEEEVGRDYDLEISERLLVGAFKYLIDHAPAAKIGLLTFLGDFLHYDGFDSVTPTSKHQLDTDSRFPKIVRAAIRSIRTSINLALAKHEKVHVILEGGNHDPATTIWLMELLACVYENEPRVTIDTSPSRYHYYRFGENLLGTHHGDKAKPDKLPGIMACDRKEDWGQTTYRYFWTCHLHKDAVVDCNGCRVETVRILAGQDAYAHQLGYRTPSDMKAIVYHKEFGEVSRNIVNPRMLG